MKKLLLTLWFLSSYSLYSLSFDDQLKNIINVVKNNDFIEIKKDFNEFFDRYKNKNFIDPRTW
jgi:hypothetical protein